MDCSTWIMVEKQRKSPYPPPPRFFPYKVTCASLIGGFQAGFVVLFVRFLCRNCNGEHVDGAWMVLTSRLVIDC
jgi:hypothetical protein